MEEDVYHAELAEVSRDSNLLNTVAGATLVVAIVFLMLGITIGEVINSKFSSADEDYGVRVPVWERGDLNYITNENWSYVMEKG